MDLYTGFMYATAAYLTFGALVGATVVVVSYREVSRDSSDTSLDPFIARFGSAWAPVVAGLVAVAWPLVLARMANPK